MDVVEIAFRSGATAGRCRRLRPGLGTWIAIEADAESAGAARVAVESAFAAIHRVDRLMHPCREGSDLSRLHDAVVGTPVAVDAWTFDCAALSLELARASSGAFDPVLPSSGGSAGHVEVIGDGALLRHAPVIVDLGGVAKGFAVDRAIDALRAFGCSSGVVNAGGDVRVFGRATMVWVRGPSACRQVEMADEALAVTDFDVADRPAEHRGYYLHGRPRAVRGMAAVRAQSAAVADALTKIVGVAECFLDEQALFQRYDARVLVAPERCP